MSSDIHLAYVTRADLEATNAVIAAAAEARGIAFYPVVAGAVSESGIGRATGQRLLYRAAVDPASVYLERLLFTPGAAAFADPNYPCADPAVVLRMQGLPAPRRVYLPAEDASGLQSQADWLGGFPIVVKQPHSEGGAGVMLAESLGTLIEILRSGSPDAALEAFTPHARAYRLLIINDEVVAVTATEPAPGDFRSNAAGAKILPGQAPPPQAAALACKAVSALRLGMGGVDLMEMADGALSIAEVNYPCYFADQQAESGTDIGGLLIDGLLARAEGNFQPI